MSAQVKSRQRVQEHGEVFTNEREVNAMLDMVKQETERIESRFLEPACGDGNFLAEVLRRKLSVVGSLYRKSPTEYMRYAFVAVASIYGVDILDDNARDCRERLYGIVENEAKAVIPDPSAERSAAVADGGKRDWVVDELAGKEFEFADARAKDGCLWVIGGGELDAEMRRLAEMGATFEFSLRGGRATAGRSAWWLKGYPAKEGSDDWQEPPAVT